MAAAHHPVLGSVLPSNDASPLLDEARRELNTLLHTDGALPSLPSTWWELDAPQQPTEANAIEGVGGDPRFIL
jgi:hypothetical protein